MRWLLLFLFCFEVMAGWQLEGGLDFRYKRKSDGFETFQPYYVIGAGREFSDSWSFNSELEWGSTSSDNGNLKIAEKEYALINWANFHLPKMRFIQSTLNAGVGAYFIDLDTHFAGESVKRRGDLTAIYGFGFSTKVEFSDILEKDYSGYFGAKLRNLSAQGFLPSPQWSILAVFGFEL